jgi:hypothetical protein
MEQTELDGERAGYVEQILQAAHDPNSIGAKYIIDDLLMEWGAKAYRQGREHMGAAVKKFVDEIKR